MSNISNWSATDDNNNKAPPSGWPEHQSPSTVNNSARAMMGAVRRSYLEQPYFNPGGVITVTSGAAFSVADTGEITDFSKYYSVGRRLKFVSVNGIQYGNVGSVGYSGGVTSVKCVLDGNAELDPQTAQAFCGLSPDDTGEIVGRLPVGLILQYSADKLPPGFLFADGNSFDPSIYTELAKIWRTNENTYRYGQEVVGGAYWPKTPDVRGRFPRYLDNGKGVDPDREIGSVQGDAIRNITGVVGHIQNSSAKGAFTKKYIDNWGGHTNGLDKYEVSFDASLVVPTAEENRPDNIAFPALIVAWHGVIPAENIAIQDLLTAFNQMQGSVDQIYAAKDEALAEFQDGATEIANNATQTIDAVAQTSLVTIDEAAATAVTTVEESRDTAITSVTDKEAEAVATGDAQVERVISAGSDASALAQSWAIGDVSSRPEGSAKYWAGQANAVLLGKADTDAANIDVAKYLEKLGFEAVDLGNMSGYAKLPFNLVIQWARGGYPSSSRILFHLAFTSLPCVTASWSAGTGASGGYGQNGQLHSLDVTGFRSSMCRDATGAVNATQALAWIAIGFI